MRKTSLTLLALASMVGPALPADAEVVGVDVSKRTSREEVASWGSMHQQPPA